MCAINIVFEFHLVRTLAPVQLFRRARENGALSSLHTYMTDADCHMAFARSDVKRNPAFINKTRRIGFPIVVYHRIVRTSG